VGLTQNHFAADLREFSRINGVLKHSRFILKAEFPTVAASGAYPGCDGEGESLRGRERPRHTVPRVRMETPAPPVLCEEHIGKEAPAGRFRLRVSFPEAVVSHWSLVVGKTSSDELANDRRSSTDDRDSF